jgi:hypothetical protein
MAKITYAELAPVFKFEKVDDQTLRVFGRATNETVDSDKQIVDLKWAAKALEDWLASGGNLRVMHNPSRDPAGVGISLDVTAGGADIAGDIVEPIAMRLVEKGALRAFSVGIAGAKIARDARAPGGRIIGGQIVEVSLVDRPANPDCVFSLAKSIDGQSEWTGTLDKAATSTDVAKSEATEVDEPVVEQVEDNGGKTEEPVAAVEQPEVTDVDKAEADNGNEDNDTTEAERANIGVADDNQDNERANVETGSPPSAIPQSDGAPSVGSPAFTSVVADSEVHTASGEETIASWAMRRLHDITCPAYSTEALKTAYATIEKDGLSAALGAPARGMLFQLLQQEVSEDNGDGTEADDIHEIAKAYNALNEFLFSEDTEVTTADFALAARETLRKGAKIEDTADPADEARSKSGRVFYGEASTLKTVHDVITRLFPSVCTLDVDKSVTVAVLTKVDGDETVELITKAVAEQTQEITTKYAVESAELVKAHSAELEKLNAKIEELSKAPQLAVTTTGGKAPSRALRGTQLNKSLAVEDVQKRAQDAERTERISFLRTLVATGDPRSADAAHEVLVQLGVND